IMTSIKEAVRLEGHEVAISHPDKVIFPKEDITKKDLVSYYQEIAKYMIPYVKNHPLMLQRFPNGIHKPGFIQQEASDYFPEWIERARVPKKGGQIEHALANNAATLAYLANQNVIS